MDIRQNTLYLTSENTFVARDHLTLRVEVERELKLAIPIHHLESVCAFGHSVLFSPEALRLCWEHGVAVNYLSSNGYLLGRWEGVPNTSVMLRQAQYRAADDPGISASISRQLILGKLLNSRISLLRSARESTSDIERQGLKSCADEIAMLVRRMTHLIPDRSQPDNSESTESPDHAGSVDLFRGYEGQAASVYFGAFDLNLRQQRLDFAFKRRTKRPPLDPINCLLSFLYALVRHDCIAALTATGLDPFVGYLHRIRPNRPSLALDLMEEFRPLIADRLAITLINRKQIRSADFERTDGGAVSLKSSARKYVISAYQSRKGDLLIHPQLQKECRVGQLFLIQARILARFLRGDLDVYLPCVLK